MDKMALGAKIREARNKCSLTQEVLAEKADIGVMYLGEIERGIKISIAIVQRCPANHGRVGSGINIKSNFVVLQRHKQRFS